MKCGRILRWLLGIWLVETVAARHILNGEDTGNSQQSHRLGRGKKKKDDFGAMTWEPINNYFKDNPLFTLTFYTLSCVNYNWTAPAWPLAIHEMQFHASFVHHVRYLCVKIKCAVIIKAIMFHHLIKLQSFILIQEHFRIYMIIILTMINSFSSEHSSSCKQENYIIDLASFSFQEIFLNIFCFNILWFFLLNKPLFAHIFATTSFFFLFFACMHIHIHVYVFMFTLYLDNESFLRRAPFTILIVLIQNSWLPVATHVGQESHNTKYQTKRSFTLWSSEYFISPSSSIASLHC